MLAKSLHSLFTESVVREAVQEDDSQANEAPEEVKSFACEEVHCKRWICESVNVLAFHPSK